MEQKWIQILMILLLCRIPSAEASLVKEGTDIGITCKPVGGSMIIWFRVLDGAVSEFIASFSSTGLLKKPGKKFSDKFKVDSNPQTLTLKSFNKDTDSGIYSCAALVGGNKLEFGEVTKLTGEETKAITPPMMHAPTQTSTTASTRCSCKEKDKIGQSMFCSPIILGALAGGCGLLLLLLIVTILYCNKMRTRRCPHHYKRKPRTDALEKQMMTNRYV